MLIVRRSISTGSLMVLSGVMGARPVEYASRLKVEARRSGRWSSPTLLLAAVTVSSSLPGGSGRVLQALSLSSTHAWIRLGGRSHAVVMLLCRDSGRLHAAVG